MKSPFPGMDPYIEERDLSRDFRLGLMSEMSRAIAELLPERYVTRIKVRRYEPLGPEEEPEEEPFIQIFAMEPNRQRQLVTIVDMLTPENKDTGKLGQKVYMVRRQEILNSPTNFVEIDLLRCGERMPTTEPWPKSPYVILVVRKNRVTGCQIVPAHFRHPLPAIPVPLLEPDPDLRIELQPMVEAIYARSRYYVDIEYDRPLSPPLTAEETAWLAEQVRQKA
jgi:hypothetical protein